MRRILLLIGGCLIGWMSYGQDTWSTKASLNVARSGGAASVINGKLYVVGGSPTSGGSTTSLEVYDPVTNVWTSLANMPTSRAVAGAAVVGDKLYVMGGCLNSDCNNPTNIVEMYDPVSNTWTTKAAMPSARSLFACASIGDKVYIAGSYGGSAVASVYDATNNLWSAITSLPVALSHAGGAAINGKFYVAGGSVSGVAVNTLYEYDPTVNTWSAKATMPTARYVPGVAVIQNQIYTVSGQSTSSPTNVLEVYNPATNSWSTKTAIPTARYGPATAAIGSVLYVAGSSATNGPITTVEAFSAGTVPTIQSISPASGVVGSTVTITGTNFSTTSSNVVYFGATRATVLTATATQLTVTVPVGATYRPVSVTVSGLTATSPRTFITTFSGGGSIDATSFPTKIDLPAGTFPDYAIIHDLDGDGMSEIIAVNGNSNNLTVFKNTNTPGSLLTSLFTPSIFSVGTAPNHVAVGDLDGDGKPDMVTVNTNSGNVSTYLNASTSGVISFTAQTTLTPGASPRYAALGDMDRDGKLDLAISNYTANTISIFKNTSTIGNISFSSVGTLTAGTNVYGLAIADLDGDYYVDIVAANQGSGTVSVFRNITTSTIAFSNKIDLGTSTSPNNVVLGDFDLDGKQDIALASNSMLSLYRNNSSVGALAAASFPRVDAGTGTNFIGLNIADLDGDGKPDIAASDNSNNRIAVFKNNSGVFNLTQVNHTTATGPMYTVAIGDLDGDGRPDMATANSSGTVSVFRNNIAATAAPTITSFNPTSGAVGTIVTITGTNFSATQANNSVSFNGVVASVSSSTTTSITTSVPSGATTGTIAVTVGGLTVVSSSSFTVPTGPAPTITNFNPTSGAVGTSVTITGTNFSATQANNSVSFNGVVASVSNSTTTTITTSVPSGATTGTITVTVGGQTATSSSNFTVPSGSAPTVTSFNPILGAAGTSVTITGTNFSSTFANNIVNFNGTAATVTGGTPTSIITSVPTGASTGPISVIVGGQMATSPTSFEVSVLPVQGSFVGNGPVGGEVKALVSSGTNLFAGTSGGGVFISNNNGVSWSAVNNGLTGLFVRSLVISGTNLFAGTNSGVFLSTNNGTSWTAVNSGLTSTNVQALLISGTNLFAAGIAGSVFLSTNNGTSWTSASTGLPTTTAVNCLAAIGTNLYAGTSGNGVYLSTNNGTSWSAVNSGLTGTNINALAVNSSNLYAATSQGVFISANNGTSWSAINTGMPGTPYALSILVNGSNLYVGTYSGVYVSSNNGANWASFNIGLTNVNAFTLLASGNYLFAGTNFGVYTSAISVAGWSAVNAGLKATFVNAFLINGSNLFAATNGSGIYLSTNNAVSWTPVNTGLTAPYVYSLASSGSNIFAGTNNGVYLSTNNGSTWVPVNSGLTNSVNSLLVSGGNLFAGTSNNGVFLSTNNGMTWSAANAGLPTTSAVNALILSGSNLFAAMGGGGVFLSTNGTSWTAVNTGLTSTNIRTLALSGTNLFAGSDAGVFLSSNNGTSWTAVNSGLTSSFVNSLIVNGTNLFAGTYSGIFQSANNGTTWTAMSSTGLTTLGMQSLAISGSYLFAGTTGNGVFVRLAPAPTITDNTPTTVANGNFLTFTAAVSDSWAPITNATVEWRSISAGGNTTTTNLTASNQTTSGATYSATINAPVIGELGVEYKISAIGSGGTSTTGSTFKLVKVEYPATTGLAIPYSSYGSTVSSYRIVAVPLDLTAKAIGNVFDELGTYNPQNWRMYRYDNANTTELSSSSTIAPGLGYWLIARTNPGTTINSGPGTTVSVTSAAPLQIDLKADWNQIGNPYNFNLSWADVQAANPGLPGLRTYTGDYVDATRLDKMTGGFVKVTTAQKLTFPVVKNIAVNGRLAAEKIPFLNELTQPDWQVVFNLTNNQRTNQISGFGMNHKAKDGFDEYDGFNMPAFFDTDLRLNHHKKEGADFYSKDIVATNDQHIWEFDVESISEERTMRLTWDNSYFGHNDKELYLWDVNQKRAIDMRTATAYSFDKGRSSSFKVIFGPKSFVKQEISVDELVFHDVWPNPSPGDVTVSFTLPESTELRTVDFTLTDVLGRIHWTQQSNFEGGYHEVTVSRNKKAEEGIYIIQLQSGAFRRQARVVLK